MLDIIERVVRPMGDLITLSKQTVPHKGFLSVLIRCRSGVKLPLELDFSFGIRRYLVLITEERGRFSAFNKVMERYELVKTKGDDMIPSEVVRSTHMVPRSEKGKQLLNQVSRDMGVGSKGMSSDRSKEVGRRNEVRQKFGGGVTILQRGSIVRPGAGRVPEERPSPVEHGSRNEGGAGMLRTSPPVELSSCGGTEKEGGLRASPQLQTDGYNERSGLNRQAQSPGRSMAGDSDKAGTCGSKARCVDCWRPCTSMMVTSVEEVTRNVPGSAEVSRSGDIFESEVDSRKLNPVDVGGPDLLSLSLG